MEEIYTFASNLMKKKDCKYQNLKTINFNILGPFV